jgi:hypothetical protein
MGKRNTPAQSIKSVQQSRGDSEMDSDYLNDLAAIEYVGVAGASKDCQDGVLRMIQWGDRVTSVKVLSYARRHCLLLTINFGDLIAIKSGFSSGYIGEGPHRFSYVLQALDSYGTEIEEFEVPLTLLERVDQSAMTKHDLEALDEAKPIRPSRWPECVNKNETSAIKV